MTTINIYQLWQLLMSEVNVQQNGQIRPASDFEGWLNKLSNDYFRQRVASGDLAQIYTDDLSPFKSTVNVAVQPLSGKPYDFIPFPENYEFFGNMKILRAKGEDGTCVCGYDEEYPLFQGPSGGKCEQVIDSDYAEMRQRYVGMNLTEVTIDKIDTQRWGSALSHPTKGPTYDSPKATQQSNGFYIAPKGLTSVILDCFKTPRKAVFAYTISADDIVIYDAANSVQLEWSNTLQAQFIADLKKIYAAHVGDTSLYQMAAADSKETI